MQIDLECKCTATHKWVLVARFEYAGLANTAARTLSQYDGCTYRVVDRRWPDHSDPSVYIFERGKELVA